MKTAEFNAKNPEPAALTRQSRITGLWYLAMAISGPVGILIIPSLLSVPGDAAATYAKISASPGLWGLGIFSYIISQLVFFPLVLGFRSFLVEVDRGMARLMVALVVAAVPISLLSLLGRALPLVLSSDPSFLSALGPLQVSALSELGLRLHGQGEIIAGFFWGLWLLPLGILVYKSGFFPKIMGIFLMMGCAAYFTDSSLAFLLPQGRAAAAPVIMALQTLGEIPFLLWLLIMGARLPKPALARSGESA